MKLHSPAGYAVAIAGAVAIIYIMPPKMRVPFAVLSIAAGFLLLRGGIDGLKKDFAG